MTDQDRNNDDSPEIHSGESARRSTVAGGMRDVRLVDVVLVGIGCAGLAIGAALLSSTRSTAHTVVLMPREVAATTTTTPPPENPVAFVGLLGAAIRTADVDWMISRLHPAVLARFGEATCRAELESMKDPSSMFTVKSVKEPALWVWKTDNNETVIPNAIAMDVDRVAYTQVLSVTIHVAEVDGKMRWFNHCGRSNSVVAPPS